MDDSTLGPDRGRTYGVLGVDEGVVDSNNIDIAVLNGIAEDNTSNAAETVDSNLCLGHDGLWLLCRKSAEVVVGYGATTR